MHFGQILVRDKSIDSGEPSPCATSIAQAVAGKDALRFGSRLGEW